MKRTVFVGALVGALAASTAFAQAAKPAKKAATDQGAGHTAPKAQPTTEAAPSAPAGEVQLGSVHIPKSVKDGVWTLRNYAGKLFTYTEESANGNGSRGGGVEPSSALIQP